MSRNDAWTDQHLTTPPQLSASRVLIVVSTQPGPVVSIILGSSRKAAPLATRFITVSLSLCQNTPGVRTTGWCAGPAPAPACKQGMT